ncbi:MAG: uracil-DNA glycosylase [Verrucomicrobiales bacterium]
MSQPIQALRALEKHLAEQQDHGVERVFLSPQSLADLNALSAAVAAASPKPVEPPAAPEPARPAAPSVVREVPARTPEPEREPDSAPSAPPPAQADAPQTSPPVAPEPAAKSDDAGKRARLRAIAIRAKRCPKTRALGSLRDQFVFATGNPDADLMLVGEAPGAEEEKQHEPFVGPAGQLLDKIVGAMGFGREQIYISNIVKFRPSTGGGNQGTGNRKPSAEEMATSVGYVLEEIEVVEPKVIVALGGTAMEGLLGLEGSVGRHRSQFHALRGVPVMVTYHPSYLLRSGENSEKRKVWEDLLLVMDELGAPISTKQRHYFQ